MELISAHMERIVDRERVVDIVGVLQIQYLELSADVSESKPPTCWEMIYLDQGEALVASGGRSFPLKQGTLLVHVPGSVWQVKAQMQCAPNALVIRFQCESPAMELLKNKVWGLGDAELKILSEMMKEGTPAAVAPVGSRKYGQGFRPRIGSAQMLKNQLEMLFIRLLRMQGICGTDSTLSSVQKERYENGIVQSIIRFIEQSDLSELTLERICRRFAFSRNHLGVMFKRTTGYGVMEYVRELKISRAKSMIREGGCSYTEIAERLGYSSIHYFSKNFKKWTGIPPSEYAKSVKARI